jgi:hypothetical protein
MMVAAIGYGVLFPLAFTGSVRIVCLLLGTTLSERTSSSSDRQSRQVASRRIGS